MYIVSRNLVLGARKQGTGHGDARKEEAGLARVGAEGRDLLSEDRVVLDALPTEGGEDVLAVGLESRLAAEKAI
jgi:hypothetical protein